MKLLFYNAKGSAGKTPLAYNTAIDKDFCIGTNEAFHVYDSLVEDNKLIALQMEEAFPQELVTHDIDIVFDLAGSISKSAVSISSALKMADFVVVPIYDEWKCLNAGVNTVNQVKEFSKNIIVVATKLQKQKGETFNDDWTQSANFRNIERAVKDKVGNDIPVLPLKFSRAFDNIFEEQKSIRQLMETNPLASYSYREVAKQFDAIYNLIGI